MTLAVAALALAGLPASVPMSEVFPIERLEPALQARAEEMLLAILDREGLFTVIGGMKPMSSGWSRAQTRQGLMSEGLEQDRQAIAALTVGPLISASLQPFSRLFEGQRTLEGAVFHTRSFRQMVEREQRFFSLYGITPSMPPGEALLAFEPDATTGRFRAYGHLFGYPDYAVTFFVEAAEAQRADPESKIVPRDFRSIPTYSLPANGFVYAVPKGADERREDREMRERAAPILAMYRRLRDRFIGPGKPGPVALMREWMCRSATECSPEIAEEKARAEAGMPNR
jgi:hypothetical protein